MSMTMLMLLGFLLLLSADNFQLMDIDMGIQKETDRDMDKDTDMDTDEGKEMHMDITVYFLNVVR